MAGRTPPERTPEQQQAYERIRALNVGTVEAIRAWVIKWEIPLINPDDDELLLLTMHEARAVELGITPKLRLSSRVWLKTHKARIVAGREVRIDG